MKKLIVTSLSAFVAVLGFTQTQVNLNLNHHYNEASFSYGTEYQTADGKAVTFDRVQYYLCGFELNHDGGQALALTDTFVLASANITNYDLGAHMFTNLEGISFDLGVDQTNNHVGSTNFPSGHPLSPQSPLMDWGWPAGYFFFVIDGTVDSNGDGTPNQFFSLRGLGDELFRNVDPLTVSETGASVDVNLYVNIADWIKSIDLTSVGSQHNASTPNVKIANNTNLETVFTTELTSNVVENELNTENKLYIDYQLPYAPTIYYTINTNNPLQLTILDMQGRVVMQKANLAKDGNFFINKELETGAYVATFSNTEVKETIKFTVTK